MATTPKKPSVETQLIPGAVELDAKTQMDLENEAKAELLAEQTALAEKQFKAAAKKRLKAEMQAANGMKEDELVPVTIDLAPHADKIVIDGVAYYHGMTYNFAPAAVNTINEIMFRTWQHEAEISDRRNRSNAYKHPQAPVIRNTAA